MFKHGRWMRLAGRTFPDAEPVGVRMTVPHHHHHRHHLGRAETMRDACNMFDLLLIHRNERREEDGRRLIHHSPCAQIPERLKGRGGLAAFTRGRMAGGRPLPPRRKSTHFGPFCFDYIPSYRSFCLICISFWTRELRCLTWGFLVLFVWLFFPRRADVQRPEPISSLPVGFN